MTEFHPANAQVGDDFLYDSQNFTLISNPASVSNWWYWDANDTAGNPAQFFYDNNNQWNGLKRIDR